MPNPKGTPKNLEPGQRKGEEPLKANISFRVSESMKEAIKAQADPPEFCRQAIQEKLERQKRSQ